MNKFLFKHWEKRYFLCRTILVVITLVSFSPSYARDSQNRLRSKDIKLKKYTFHDSLIIANNTRYDIQMAYEVADTSAMTREQAIELNALLFNGFNAEDIYRDPGLIFRNYREKGMLEMKDDMYEDDEDMRYYQEYHWGMKYNQNDILCTYRYSLEYMGGARPWHTNYSTIHDLEKKKNTKDKRHFLLP